MSNPPIQITPQIRNHIMKHLPNLLIRDYLLDIFTRTDKTKAKFIDEHVVEPTEPCYIYNGKLLDIDNKLYGVIGRNVDIKEWEGEPLAVEALNIPTIPQLVSRNSPITVNPGEILNYKGSEPMVTTTGRLLLNYAILVDSFGDYISYINQEWNIGKVENTYIFEGLRTEKLTVEQINHYSRNLHFIGHFTELAVPTFSQKSLIISPEIIKRRDELLKIHRKEIDAGDTVVMSKIEKELIDMDRKDLSTDESMLFYDDNKSFNVARKTMYILGGMVEEFGGKGYAFIENSLEEGWNPKNFAIISDEIRRGSYDRAIETAKGGEATKFLIRVFQNTRVQEDDCGSQRYLKLRLSSMIIDKLLYRNIHVNGSLITLTPDNIKSYLDREIELRSPMYCNTANGYCFTCTGELFKTIDQEQLTMAAINISSYFTNAALKSMHGVSVKRIEVTSLNQFAI